MLRRTALLIALVIITTTCLDSGVECEYSCSRSEAVYQDGTLECTDAAWNQCQCICPTAAVATACAASRPT
jgi:hypothetical protein